MGNTHQLEYSKDIYEYNGNHSMIIVPQARETYYELKLNKVMRNNALKLFDSHN